MKENIPQRCLPVKAQKGETQKLNGDFYGKPHQPDNGKALDRPIHLNGFRGRSHLPGIVKAQMRVY